MGFDDDKKGTTNVDVIYECIDENIDRLAADKHRVDINTFIAQLFNTFDIGINIKKVVDPNLDYVVKFTPELLKKMKEHDVQFLKDRLTGELLPDLYDYTEKGIGGKVRLEIRGQPTEQDFANLNNSLNNLIEQQRYESLAEEIQKLHIAVKSIERGQDKDRFSMVKVGINYLLDAFDYNGAEEEKKKIIFDALDKLRTGRELVESILVDKLDALEYVSEIEIKRLWTCFIQPDYFEKQTGLYEDIQEYFKYYYTSIQFMAYAYTYLGQTKWIERLLEDSRKVFEHSKIGCLSTIEYLLPDGKFEGMWYRKAKIYQKKLLDSYRDIENDKNFYIKIKGYEILEVIGNGKKGQKEN